MKKELLQNIWWYITDTIVPPSEEHLTVRHLQSLAEHMAVQHHDENIITLMAFHDPVVRACIHEAKFAGNAKG